MAEKKIKYELNCYDESQDIKCSCSCSGSVTVINTLVSDPASLANLKKDAPNILILGD